MAFRRLLQRLRSKRGSKVRDPKNEFEKAADSKKGSKRGSKVKGPNYEAEKATDRRPETTRSMKGSLKKLLHRRKNKKEEIKKGSSVLVGIEEVGFGSEKKVGTAREFHPPRPTQRGDYGPPLRFLTATEEEMPDIVRVPSNDSSRTSTTLSSAASSSDNESSESASFARYCSALEEPTKSPSNDPYADVREDLEKCIALDKQKYWERKYGGVFHDNNESMPLLTAVLVYLSYVVLILIGQIRDLTALATKRGRYVQKVTVYPSDCRRYYAPLLKGWDNFFMRRIYHRLQDVFNRPVASNPGREVTVLERVSHDHRKSMKVLGCVSNLDTEHQRRSLRRSSSFVDAHDKSAARACLNLGSYNYLGFADDWDSTCAADVKGSLNDLSISTGSSCAEYGTTALHRQVEQTIADFVGKEAAVCFNMGFNTNQTTIPALVGKGDLLVSDALNHTSIVKGARASGASVKVFPHNDLPSLEEILRAAVLGQKWNKILVIVEGIYSMEGEYCDLRNVVRICKQYGAYVYLDEAHSIGAMGATGRGIAEYTGVDPADIDIMMGTFTKSFGGMGGYIAASKGMISHLRRQCSASLYHNSLSPVVCQQILTSFKIILGQDGTGVGARKLQALRDNSNYFRMRLREMGLLVLGNYDSPVVPIMLYHPGKIASFSRECLKRGLAVVVVGFPAVPLLLSRARFCVSAAHTREDLDKALAAIDEVADILKIRYAR